MDMAGQTKRHFTMTLTLCLLVALSLMASDGRPYNGRILNRNRFKDACPSVALHPCLIPPYGTRTRTCIPSTLICDGQNDCPMGDDERGCKCGRPPVVPDAHLTHISNSLCEYECNHGYAPFAKGLRMYTKCQSNSQWSAALFKCVKIDCGLPPPISNAMISPNATTAFSTGTYVCNNGYSPINAVTATIKCLATGSWESTPFECEAKVAFSSFKTEKLAYEYDEVIVFENVLFNQGFGYNTTSGVFTAPVAGLYYFTVHVCNQAGWYAVVAIVHNGVQTAITTQQDAGVSSCGSVSSIIYVEVGGEVYVISGDQYTRLVANEFRQNKFMGFLVQA